MNIWLVFLFQIMVLIGGMKMFSIPPLDIKQSVGLLILSRILTYFLGVWPLFFLLAIVFLWRRRLSASGLITIGAVMLSVLSYFLAATITKDSSLPLAFSLTINAFIILGGFSFLLLKKKREMFFNLKTLTISILLWTMLMVYAEVFIHAYFEFPQEVVKVRGSFLFTYLMTISLLIWNLIRIMDAKRKIELEKVRLEHQQKEEQQLRAFWQQIEQSNETLRKFHHDYRNTMLMLQGLGSADDIEGIKKCLKEILAESEVVDNFKASQLKNLHVPALKGLLESKMAEAQASYIDLQLEVMEPIEEVPMNVISLGKVLGIFLDNALDEVRELGKGQIKVAFIKGEEFLWLIVSNSCREKLPTMRQLFQRGFSTKGENRGFGLDYVNEIIDKNDHLELRTYAKNGIFEQHLKLRKERGN